MAQYFKLPNGYVAVTDECPPGFKGALYAGRDTEGKEQLFTIPQIKTMTPVLLADVPREWIQKFGYDPVPPEPVDEIVLLDPEGENLVDFIPVYDATLAHHPNAEYQLGCIIGLVIGILYLIVRNF